MGRTLFAVAGIALIGWALMILAPAWRFTRLLVRHELFPVFLAGLYVVGIIDILLTGPPVVWDFGDVENVLSLLAREDVALLAWIHILAFDHLVAVVIFRDNAEHRYIPLWVQSLILVFTLFFGPLGYIAYYITRLARRAGRGRSMNLDSAAGQGT